MNTTPLSCLFAAALCAISLPAFAAPQSSSADPTPAASSPAMDASQASRGMAQLDANQDGLLSREELQDKPRLAGKFDAIDSNGDGQLSGEERSSHHQAVRSQRQARLKTADRDGNGKLDRDEVAEMPKLVERFAELDADGDGFLDVDEASTRRRR